MNLFCIPYAGGNEDIFSNWNIGPDITINPILLKGRKERLLGENYQSMEDAINDCCEQILLRHNFNTSYCIFGHSMGAVIAYEVYYMLHKMGAPLPNKIIFSSCNLPGIKFTGKKFSKLEDEELVNAIASLGGVDERLLQHREILYFYLNIFRNDMKLLEEYKPCIYKEPILSDISVFYSKEDILLDQKSIERWEKITSRKCTFHEFQGGHFFINCNKKQLLNELRIELSGSLERNT